MKTPLLLSALCGLSLLLCMPGQAHAQRPTPQKSPQTAYPFTVETEAPQPVSPTPRPIALPIQNGSTTEIIGRKGFLDSMPEDSLKQTIGDPIPTTDDDVLRVWPNPSVSGSRVNVAWASASSPESLSVSLLRADGSPYTQWQGYQAQSLLEQGLVLPQAGTWFLRISQGSQQQMLRLRAL